MEFRVPRWVWTSLTVVAVIGAATAGYQSDLRHLRASQDQELSQLSTALNTALQATESLQRKSVRQPRLSANLDTLEFALAKPLLVTPGVVIEAQDLFADSLCRQSVNGRLKRDQAGLGAVPVRLWVLDFVRIYVDKERGGLWRTGTGREPELVADRVETLAVELDHSREASVGFLLELTGSWDVGVTPPMRRKLYHYLPSVEMSRG